VDHFILTLGWVGVYAPLALGAIGSMVGVTRGGMAACGALLEVESGYGRFIGVSAMPSSQTIYGIVVTVALMVSGFAQGSACAAAINASKSKPEVFGISIAPAAVVEGFAVFAFVFALVLAGSVPGMGG
jgi:V/A-type H+-transporting ATPase subunit K